MIDDVITFRLHRIKDVIRIFFLFFSSAFSYGKKRFAPISAVIRQLKHTLQFLPPFTCFSPAPLMRPYHNLIVFFFHPLQLSYLVLIVFGALQLDSFDHNYLVKVVLVSQVLLLHQIKLK